MRRKRTSLLLGLTTAWPPVVAMRPILRHSTSVNATQVSSSELGREDVVFVRAGDQIPADGEVIVGAASVDESAITGESAPGYSASRAATAPALRVARRFFPTGW